MRLSVIYQPVAQTHGPGCTLCMYTEALTDNSNWAAHRRWPRSRTMWDSRSSAPSRRWSHSSRNARWSGTWAPDRRPHACPANRRRRSFQWRAIGDLERNGRPFNAQTCKKMVRKYQSQPNKSFTKIQPIKYIFFGLLLRYKALAFYTYFRLTCNCNLITLCKFVEIRVHLIKTKTRRNPAQIHKITLIYTCC